MISHVVRVLVLSICFTLSKAQVTTQTFNFSGTLQTFTVPACVFNLSITAFGAQGGTNSNSTTVGGLGGRAIGVLTVTPGTVLNIYVGGTNGYNGGGAAGVCQNSPLSNGGVGGGASDVRINGIALANRIIVAGGGGGAGGDRIPSYGRGAGGGGGAGYYGGGGGSGWVGSSATGWSLATGGTQISGGSGGTALNAANNGNNGALGQGGSGGGEIGSGQGTPTQQSYIGGEGGGLIGGNGVHTTGVSNWVGMSGAGGSSYIGGLLNASTTSSINTGNGRVIISYIPSGAPVAISAPVNAICTGGSVLLTASGAISYTWSTGSNNSTITVSPNTTTTYTLNGTGVSGCISSTVITINVSTGIPTLAVTSSTNQTCLGKTATLTATGALSYTWSNGVQNGVSFNPSVTTTYTVFGQNGCGTSSAVTSITVAPIPVQAIAGPSTICYGQASTLTAISGANQYTFAPLNYTANTGVLVVSPTVSTLYTITVSDGTCSGVAQVSLNVNPIPTVAIAASSSLACQGAAVTMTASGGTSYTWYPGGSNGTTYTATPSSPTLYSVVASNSFGCLAWGNQVVLTAPSPTVTISASNTLICAGTTISLTAGGATTYSWNSGATSASIIDAPVTTTVYAVTGYSNTCSNTKTVQVSVFNPTLAITGPTAICKGQTASLTASPADSYTWSTGSPFAGIVVNPSVTTVYSLSALTTSDNITCPSTASVQLVVNPLPTVTAVASKTSVCRGQSFTLTAGGASNYTWSTGATSASLVTSSTLVANVNYTLTGTDVNGCSSSTVITIKVNSCIGIEEQAKQVFNIYPNPSSGLIRIEAETETEITITNALGQHIKTLTLNAQNNFQFIFYDLAPGIYNFNNASLSKKLIIK